MSDMYTVRRLTQNEFSSIKQEWNELLQTSSADPLFMSWEWMHTWWSIFSVMYDFELLLLGVYDNNQNLVALAPLYFSKLQGKSGREITRVQFIGNCWRGCKTMRTEKVDFIVKNDLNADIVSELLDRLYCDYQWDELVICDLLETSETHKTITSGKLPYRIAESFDTFHLELPQNFSDYLLQLGKFTRLKIYNRRKRLLQKGHVEVRFLQDDLEECFDVLNTLHKKRWGNEAFLDERLEFNKKVASYFVERKALHFIVLYVNGEPESVQYNYRVDGVEYNIQAGFNEHLDRKLSLGYLLFGYAIENAIASGIRCYDFLAGGGKNTQYKSRLTGQKQKVVDIQIFRRHWYTFFYRVYDLFVR